MELLIGSLCFSLFAKVYILGQEKGQKPLMDGKPKLATLLDVSIKQFNPFYATTDKSPSDCQPRKSTTPSIRLPPASLTRSVSIIFFLYAALRDPLSRWRHFYQHPPDPPSIPQLKRCTVLKRVSFRQYTGQALPIPTPLWRLIAL